jgi:hypothetical protein
MSNSTAGRFGFLAASTVLTARDVDRTNRSLYYRWKRGIESREDYSGPDI